MKGAWCVVICCVAWCVVRGAQFLCRSEARRSKDTYVGRGRYGTISEGHRYTVVVRIDWHTVKFTVCTIHIDWLAGAVHYLSYTGLPRFSRKRIRRTTTTGTLDYGPTPVCTCNTDLLTVQIHWLVYPEHRVSIYLYDDCIWYGTLLRRCWCESSQLIFSTWSEIFVFHWSASR